MINTLLYTKRLEAVGLTREVAEVHVEILTEVIETNLATNQDVKDLRQEIREATSTLRHEMHDMGITLRHEMREMESRILVRVGGMMFAMTAFSTTTIVALIKFL